MMFHYISVLAGGTCRFNCHFCVGQSIRRNEPPHFASREQIEGFLATYKRSTNKLSISGSTSDPTFCDDLSFVIESSRELSVKLHTCNLEWLCDNEWIFSTIDGVVASVHVVPDRRSIDMLGRHDNIRVSVVYTKENKAIIDSKEFFDSIPVDTFTIRKNVFDPMTPLCCVERVGELFHQPIFTIDGKTVILWDFADANQHINARYLWPDGVVNRQCYWYTLYNVNTHERTI